MKYLLMRLANLLVTQQPKRDLADDDLEYLLWIVNVFNMVEKVPGHIAEVGVAGGRNAVYFGMLIKLARQQSIRQYIGFDTFEGFQPRDLHRNRLLREEAWKDCTLEVVEARCRRNGVWDLVELVKGDACTTVPRVLAEVGGKKFRPGKALFSLVYIDCNAYAPAISSLEAFHPFMAPGAVFIVDEKIQGEETEAAIEFARRLDLNVERAGLNHPPLVIRL